MLKFVSENTDCFNECFRTYLSEDGKYKIHFVYSLYRGPKESLDIRNYKDFRICCLPIDNQTLDIDISHIHKAGDEKNEREDLFGPKIYRFLREFRFWSEMTNQTGEWAEAGKTLVDIDEELRKLHPGYYITNKHSC